MKLKSYIICAAILLISYCSFAAQARNAGMLYHSGGQPVAFAPLQISQGATSAFVEESNNENSVKNQVASTNFATYPSNSDMRTLLFAITAMVLLLLISYNSNPRSTKTKLNAGH